MLEKRLSYMKKSQHKKEEAEEHEKFLKAERDKDKLVKKKEEVTPRVKSPTIG